MTSLFTLNGCITYGYSSSVKIKLECIRARASSSNYWLSRENSATNAYNANISGLNLNNNNKYNSNYLRGVAALDDKQIESVVEAYSDCLKNKKGSVECTKYRLLREEDLVCLAVEIFNQTYFPSRARIFCVPYPKIREVCAANFRDRIVQHWVCIRLEPLFEDRFIKMGDVSFNCRKGKGVKKAVDVVNSDIELLSKNYTKRCFVGRFDYKNFFYSIDGERLLYLLISFIERNYHGEYKDELIYLTASIIIHRPVKNCVRQGNFQLFKLLPKEKSLFYRTGLIGVAIGNLTSQLFANFYLSYVDKYAITLCKKYGYKYERFVDDFVIIGNNSKIIMKIYKKIRIFARVFLHIELHPNKIYIQDVTKGVKFVGTYIKPHRKYIANRTRSRLLIRVYQIDKLCYKILNKTESDIESLGLYFKLNNLVASINSYMGLMCDKQAYNIKKKAFENRPNFWKICYLGKNFNIVRIKNKYKINNILLEDEKVWQRNTAA